MNEKLELNFFTDYMVETPNQAPLCTLSQVNLVEFVADILDRNKETDVHFIVLQHFLHKEAALLPASELDRVISWKCDSFFEQCICK